MKVYIELETIEMLICSRCGKECREEKVALIIVESGDIYEVYCEECQE